MARCGSAICLVWAMLAARGATPAPSARFQQVASQAAAARDAGHVDEAVPLYKRAVQLKPDWAEGWWNLGTLQYDRNAYPPARTAFRRAV